MSRGEGTMAEHEFVRSTIDLQIEQNFLQTVPAFPSAALIQIKGIRARLIVNNIGRCQAAKAENSNKLGNWRSLPDWGTCIPGGPPIRQDLWSALAPVGGLIWRLSASRIPPSPNFWMQSWIFLRTGQLQEPNICCELGPSGPVDENGPSGDGETNYPT